MSLTWVQQDASHNVLDSFLQGDVLGQGGQGIVYAAKRASDASLVAMKVMPLSTIERGHAALSFQRELEAHDGLLAPHQNLVRKLGVFVSEHPDPAWRRKKMVVQIMSFAGSSLRDLLMEQLQNCVQLMTPDGLVFTPWAARIKDLKGFWPTYKILRLQGQGLTSTRHYKSLKGLIRQGPGFSYRPWNAL